MNKGELVGSVLFLDFVFVFNERWIKKIKNFLEGSPARVNVNICSLGRKLECVGLGMGLGNFSENIK